MCEVERGGKDTREYYRSVYSKLEGREPRKEGKEKGQSEYKDTRNDSSV